MPTIKKAGKKIGNMSYNDVSTLIFAVLFLIGVTIGTYLYVSQATADKLNTFGNIADDFITMRLGQTFLQTLVNSFSGPFILLLVCFLIGFGAVFQPVETAVPLFRGIGIGTSLAGMYAAYGFDGVAVSLILIVPHGVVSAFVLIIAARESMRMSNSLANVLFSRKQGHEPFDCKLYLTKFVVLVAILTVSSFFDSLLTFLFADFWTSIVS